jgi:hypothetical protein
MVDLLLASNTQKTSLKIRLRLTSKINLVRDNAKTDHEGLLRVPEKNLVEDG